MPQRNPINSGVEQTTAGHSDHMAMEGFRRSCMSNAVMQGLRSECAAVWFERGLYERAESRYYVKLQENQNGTTAPASSKINQETCYHGDQEACPHVVHTGWMKKPILDQAESNFVARYPKQPNSVTTPSSLQLFCTSPSTSTLSDEGYLSQTPTPATPATRPINGLPFLPAPLHGVWFQKPLYDRAEADFYRNLCHQNEPHCKPTETRDNQAIGLKNLNGTSAKEPKPEQQKGRSNGGRSNGGRSNGGHSNGSHSNGSHSNGSHSNGSHSNGSHSNGSHSNGSHSKAETRDNQAIGLKNLNGSSAKEPKPEQQKPCSNGGRSRSGQNNGSRNNGSSSNGVKKGGGETWCHFLHADSERVWIDRSSYVEAESNFYKAIAARTSQTATVLSSSSLKMTGVDYLAQERIWFDKPCYDEAERRFYERMNGPTLPTQDSGANSILQDIARARENIQKSLAGTSGGVSADQGELVARMNNLELENQNLHKMVEELRAALCKLKCRVSVLEKRPSAGPVVNGTAPHTAAVPPQKTPSALTNSDDEEDGDIDLFGSDEEVDKEAERLKEQRLQEYAAKKAKKPALIAKSSILLDVKPWDDETDMAKLEECVRSVQVDGLLWGASKLVPVGYGIKKLQINCVVEDDKVGTDLLEEEITKFEDYVQSVDVAAFNKI